MGLDENDNDFKTIGQKGGTKTHSLIKAELPPNTFSTVRGSGNLNYGGILAVEKCDGVIISNEDFGGTSQAFSIVQPYQVVGYMWIRTA